LDDSQSLKDRLEWLEGLNEARQLSAQHIETMQRRRNVQFDKKTQVSNSCSWHVSDGIRC
jgi:hypothetical protein